MKKRELLALLLVAVLTVSLCGCGGGETVSDPASEPTVTLADYRWEHVGAYRSIVVTQPGDIEYLFQEGGGSPYAENHAQDYCLVQFTPTGAGENVYNPQATLTANHTRTPVRIDKVCFAGANVPLQAGDTLTVKEGYYLHPQNEVFTSRLNGVPLVEGHRFFAVLYRPETDGGLYFVEECFPVEAYTAFSEYANIPEILKNEAIRTSLVETYGD